MRLLDLKASLMLGVEPRSKRPSVSWKVIRPRERLIIKLDKSRLGKHFHETIE